MMKKRDTHTLTVGLMWHSVASDNLGVGALTVSQIAIVEKIAAEIERPVRFVVLGWSEATEPYIVAPNVRPGQLRTRNLVNPRGFASEVRECDFVLDIGAGDSFSDIYGVNRFLKYMAAKATVHAVGRPLIVSPQTVGPFRRGWARRLALMTLRRCEMVFTRDQMSIDVLRDAGFSKPIHLASDVALRLPYDAPKPRPADGPTRVGVNVSGLLMNGGYTGTNMFGLAVDYPAMMRRLITHFAEMNNCEVHLIPHVISDTFPVEDDWRASKALRDEISDKIILAPKFASPSEAKSYVAGMDFFMGARMHACIAAFSSGVPVIPIAYSRKFSGLFDALGYQYTVDCTKEDTASAETKILSHFKNRETLIGALAPTFQLGLERLETYEYELKKAMLRTLEE